MKKQHKGQVALVLVLVMTVVGALAVSLATRSTVETRIQQTQTESTEALLNAQTGIEQLIMNPAPSVGAPGSNFYAVTSDAGSDSLAVNSIEAGGSVEVNLSGATNLTGFQVYWGPGGSLGQPAILISVIENSGNIVDSAFDYDGLNGFTAGLSGAGGYAKTTGVIVLSAGAQKIRITVLGSPAILKVVPIGAGALFPPQVKLIRSTGSVLSEEQVVRYGLQYNESASDNTPSVFDYVLFSGGSIIQ